MDLCTRTLSRRLGLLGSRSPVAGATLCAARLQSESEPDAMGARGKERDNDNKSKRRPQVRRPHDQQARPTSKDDTFEPARGVGSPTLGWGGLVPLYCKHALRGRTRSTKRTNQNKTRRLTAASHPSPPPPHTEQAWAYKQGGHFRDCTRVAAERQGRGARPKQGQQLAPIASLVTYHPCIHTGEGW